MATVKVKSEQKFSPDASKPLFTWVAPEFIRYKKSTKWYIGVSVVGLLLAFIFFLQKQWSSVALVVVASLSFMLLSGAKPKKVTSALYQDGIVIDGKVYGFNQFKSFWIEKGDLVKARLQLLGRFAGQVTLPIFEIDPEQVRLFLGKHLPEEERGADLVDSINQIMRF